MTRRWSIAGGGICSLVLLPGCLGGNLTNNAANGTRPGYVLAEPPRSPSFLSNGPANAVARQQPPVQQPYTLIGRRSVDPVLQAPGSAGFAPRVQQAARAVPVATPAQRAVGDTLPPPDPVQPAAATEVAAPAEPKTEKPAVGADWDKITQALGNPSGAATRAAGPFTASPIAMLASPVKARGTVGGEPDPRPAGRSLKLSDIPASPPTLTGPKPPVILPSIPDNDMPSAATPAPNAPAAPVGPPAASAAPGSADSPLVLAVRAFQEKRHDEAVEYLKKYDPSNQEVLLFLMPLMVRLGEGNLAAMPPEELAAYVDRLQGASGVMRAKAALRLDTVCFCRQVFNFGKYERLDPNASLQPGEPVHVYAEIHNFTWEPAAPGRGYVMRLAHSLEIRDTQGRVVWRTDPRPKDDVRQTPPTDYYLVYSFAMPDSLPPGAYTLTVQVTDKPTGRLVRRPVEFRLGGR